jgi:hypothetical protein
VIGNLDDPRLGFLRHCPNLLLGAAPLPLARDSVSTFIFHRFGKLSDLFERSPVSNDVLTPEFTDYRKRVIYQVYDVTASLVNGKNSIAAMLGDGWFGSSLTWTSVRLFLRHPIDSSRNWKLITVTEATNDCHRRIMEGCTVSHSAFGDLCW